VNGEYQRRLNVTIDEEMERRLLRYCSLHGITKRDAVRRAIAELLAQRRTTPPTLDPDRPL
jgi:hypothetical protein